MEWGEWTDLCGMWDAMLLMCEMSDTMHSQLVKQHFNFVNSDLNCSSERMQLLYTGVRSFGYKEYLVQPTWMIRKNTLLLFDFTIKKSSFYKPSIVDSVFVVSWIWGLHRVTLWLKKKNSDVNKIIIFFFLKMFLIFLIPYIGSMKINDIAPFRSMNGKM